MTREPQSNPAHCGTSSEKEFDPLSETLDLPPNQDDTANEIELVAVPATRELDFLREPHVGMRRVTVTLSDEPWLASRAKPLDRELHKLPLLTHPGIVRIRAVIKTKTGWQIDLDNPAISSTLAADLQLRTRPWRQAVEFVAELADIVAAAHDAGVRHGALRPEVILLTDDDKPLIADFGLGVLGTACRVEGSLAANLGPCTAPEQIHSWPIPVDARSDVYALGVILYHLLCSRSPFRAADQDELRRAIVDDAPQPPRQLAHGLPQPLEQLCLRLLAKEPFARPADAEELARELRQVHAETETIDPAAGLTAPRKTAAVQSDHELRMIVSWDTPPSRLGLRPDPPRLQQTTREYITRNRGLVLRETDSETIAQLPPTDNQGGNRMSSFLSHALTLVSEWKPENSTIGFTIDSAESDTLKHRAPRLSGRISARGFEVSPATSEVLRRWLPCRRPQTPESSDRSLPTSATELESWEVKLSTDRWLPISVIASDPTIPAPPMVGRGSQLAILKTRWDQTCEGMGQFVLLIGDEGSGKTRLIQELSVVVAASNNDSQWIHWSCRPGERGVGSTIFRNSPTNDFSSSGRDLGEFRKIEDPTPELRRDRWQQETLDWLKQLAMASPVVFVVEDLQWIDPTTLAFLHRLIDLGLNERVLTILTFRPEFETPWGSRAYQTQVALSRLTKRNAAAMFSAITGVTEPPANLVDQLIAATDGIPLFVEGFAHAWLRSESRRTCANTGPSNNETDPTELASVASGFCTTP